MSNQIKCSYEACYRRFKTSEAMKKHKAKDSAHDYYCKKCDVDCNDDTELLYHQITSSRHMACPVCGREFKSESGMDRHVEIDHIPKQDIECVGCNCKFDKASSLMAHIERNECEVIKRLHFQCQRAEQQIAQDAWEATQDPTAGATILSNARQYAAPDSEMNLLDDERAFVTRDWQGLPQVDEENERNGPYVGPPSETMSNLSISRFPPLGPQNHAQAQRSPQAIDPLADLVDLNEVDIGTRPPISQGGVWAGTESASRLFKNTTSGTSRSQTSNKRDPSSSTNLLDSFTEDDLDHKSTTSSLKPQPSTLPPSARAENLDPNHPHARITTDTILNPPSHLQIHAFWDPVLNTYVCPSQRCGAHFSTPQAFQSHLLGPIHSPEKVRCPACSKKFKTTTALIAHCESGSRKCRVRDTLDFDKVIRQATAGILAVDGFTEEGAVRYTAQQVEDW